MEETRKESKTRDWVFSCSDHAQLHDAVCDAIWCEVHSPLELDVMLPGSMP
jgi:hypothetical protein